MELFKSKGSNGSSGAMPGDIDVCKSCKYYDGKRGCNHTDHTSILDFRKSDKFYCCHYIFCSKDFDEAIAHHRIVTQESCDAARDLTKTIIDDDELDLPYDLVVNFQS